MSIIPISKNMMVRPVYYFRSVFDMEDGHFESQLSQEAVGAEVRESFGELLWRGVCGESFYWVGCGLFPSRMKNFRVPSQHGDGQISLRWV